MSNRRRRSAGRRSELSRSSSRLWAHARLRGRPCPVAGRSFRPSMASTRSDPPALRPPGLRLSATPALGARATPRWRRWRWVRGGGPKEAALGVGAGRWAEGSCRASRSGFDFLGHAEDFVEARDPAEDLLDAVVEHHPHPVGTRGAADVLRGGPLEGELADLAAHHHQFEDP